MRSLVFILCGAPGRVAVSAAALATVGLTAAGQLNALIAAAFYTAMWGVSFGIAFMILAILGMGTGVLDGKEAVAEASKEAERDRG